MFYEKSLLYTKSKMLRAGLIPPFVFTGLKTSISFTNHLFNDVWIRSGNCLVPGNLSKRGETQPISFHVELLLPNLLTMNFGLKDQNFLHSSSEDWPTYDHERTEEDDTTEIVVLLSSNNQINPDPSLLFNLDNFNDYHRLLRVTAWIQRFITNVRHFKKEERKLDELNSGEIEKAKKMWLRFVQRNMVEVKGYKQLNKDLRFFEDEGIIRCQGRLENAPLAYPLSFLFLFLEIASWQS